jgi:hypothetical protein
MFYPVEFNTYGNGTSPFMSYRWDDEALAWKKHFRITDHLGSARTTLKEDGGGGYAVTGETICEAYERLGLLDSAVIVYDSLLVRFSSSVDIMNARWRLQFLSTFSKDSIFGDIYDSCMTNYSQRIIDDLTPAIEDTMPKAPDFDFNKNEIFDEGDDLMISLELVKPNPIKELTEVRFYLSEKSRIRLRILDVNGKETASLMEGEASTGWSSINFDGSQYSNGVYIITLDAGGKKTAQLIYKVD